MTFENQDERQSVIGWHQLGDPPESENQLQKEGGVNLE